MKTWRNKRTIVRSRRTGHFASKGWGKAYRRQKVRWFHTLFHLARSHWK